MTRTRKLGEWQEGTDPRAVTEEDDERAGTAEYGVIVPPAVLAVMLTCPTCDMQLQIAAKLQTRVTRDSDGTGALALRVKSAKTQHVCGQQALGLIEGDRER